MNILGLVSSLLIMLALSTGLMLNRHGHSQNISRSFNGYCSVERKLRNEHERSKFPKKIKKAKSRNKNNTTAKQKKNRTQNKIYPCSQLNLMPLFEKKVDPTGEQRFIALLHILYGNGPLKHQLEGSLASEIIRGGRKLFCKESTTPQSIQIEKIELASKETQFIYYQMLKGTKFDETPSLLDYVRCEKGDEKICLKHAPWPILALLFNEKAATLIEDQRKTAPLNEEMLHNILRSCNCPISAKTTDRISYTHFQKKRKTKLYSATHEGSQIRLKRYTPLSS